MSPETSLAEPGPEALAPAKTPVGRHAVPDDSSDVEILITPRSGWVAVDWKELYRNRELLFFMVWRDLKVRYKQTVLGATWAILQPLVTLTIFTLIFGKFAKIPSEGFAYPVFAFAGLMPWTFFSSGMASAGQSLVNQQGLLSKVYFPRLFIPTAAVASYLVDFAISFGLYAGILAWYRTVPSWQVVFLPALIALTMLPALGLGYLLGGLTVFYRDFRYVVPFMVQILMYLSPIIYPMNLLSPVYRRVLALNPMVGIIEGYRSAILGTPWQLDSLATSVVVSLALFAVGILYFRKVERWFADFA
jgi:lipopolysaccharide transport system permease protein